MTKENSGAYRIGIYPGTFDPITKGHLHIIKRASKLVDRLIIGVANNQPKNPLFDLETRRTLAEAEIENLRTQGFDIEVQSFDTLLVHYAQNVGASVVFRGLRAVSDFEYEFQMTGMNAQLAPDIETLFLMASDKHQFVSSAFVKEICRMGGDITPFVSESVKNQLISKLR